MIRTSLITLTTMLWSPAGYAQNPRLPRHRLRPRPRDRPIASLPARRAGFPKAKPASLATSESADCASLIRSAPPSQRRLLAPASKRSFPTVAARIRSKNSFANSAHSPRMSRSYHRARIRATRWLMRTTIATCFQQSACPNPAPIRTPSGRPTPVTPRARWR
jgi:hypothetical protein